MVYELLASFFESDLVNIVIGIIGAAFVLYSAVHNLTTISALAQMSSVTSRAASWSDLTKKPIKKIESLQKEISGLVSKKNVSSSGSGVVEKEPSTPSPQDALDHVKTQDKITYTFGSINLMLTGFIAGAVPHYYWLWHTPKLIGYITHRWWTFKQEGKHYLLFDLCYFVNFLFMFYLIFYPQNEMLFYMSFILSNGPVGWAVLAFNQSLILHSVPHMTSVFIHASPVVLTYCLRWFPSTTHKVCDDFPACKTTEFWKNLVLQPQYFYLTWVVTYYIFIYFVMDHRIRTRGYQTLFNRIITSGPTKKIAKLSTSEMVQKSIYMGVHVLFATFTMLLATVYFRSQVAHFIFMFCVLAASAWNAAGFYFSVFLNQYSDSLKKRAGIADEIHHHDPKGCDTPQMLRDLGKLEKHVSEVDFGAGNLPPTRHPGHHGQQHHHVNNGEEGEDQKSK